MNLYLVITGITKVHAYINATVLLLEGWGLGDTVEAEFPDCLLYKVQVFVSVCVNLFQLYYTVRLCVCVCMCVCACVCMCVCACTYMCICHFKC